ncbi:TetR/AcrR family transcriptional regulator [uncultured Phenylobacterium sp.]|uniref:TetR/AcrR family transcriptional regulator n=1 Tax=uncultured Phenylobacterium sp. TaxID=349273 RepID=UPI0025CCF9C7|nr:TetR/AcrR family transcriptional regulator [uncultured Phenylobacterium sp.]
MRYSDTHKEETRRKVVRAAATAVRAKGPEGVGVAEIMAEAGLTHGGFYAHFPSKEALVVAAIDEAFGQSARRFARMLDGLDGPQSLGAFVDAYVSPAHRDNPASGCPIATLSSDLPRQGQPVRQAYERGVRALIGRLQNWLSEDRRHLAASLLAEMAGAVSLSRAMSDDEDAARLLADARANLKTRMGIDQ